ncbi:GerMN domain-containing protein [Ruicaihuangia caeni]|uniref:GerMN domain-containing protein n=1 Tax=Ruicaihuangia caeni TaxID=3042517 RepID=UPI00338FF0A8
MKRRTLRRVAIAASVMVVAATLLTGCVAIPTSSGVVEGGSIAEEDAPASVLLPQGPEAGAEPLGILQGFLRAGTGPQSDYSVAREFLTDEFRDRWNPRAGTTVAQQGAESFIDVGERVIEYRVVPQATVDAWGRYTESESTGPQLMQFTFERVRGEWRISDAPDGTVLTASAFPLIFKPYTLQFFDPTFRFLVPDERWFPSTALSSLSRRIAEALLEGPSEWLAAAVVTEFPNGTRLGPDGVRIESNRAIVDLSAEATEADADRLQRMHQQLQASLADVTSVTSVALSVNQTEVVLPEMNGQQAVAEPEVDPRSVVLTEDGFGYLQQGELAPLPGLSEQVTQLRPDAISFSSALGLAAVRTPAGVYAVQSGGSRLIDERPELVAPALDSLGFVWSAQARDPSSLVAIGSDGVQHPLASPLPARGVLRGMEVARDDTRMLFLFEIDGRSRLLTGAIVRDGGVPIAIGALRPIVTSETSIVSATWSDQVHIATLDRAEADYRVTLHTVGGMSEPLGRIPGGTSIVGGNGPDGLRVLGPEGVVYQGRGTGWQSTSVTALVLAHRR